MFPFFQARAIDTKGNPQSWRPRHYVTWVPLVNQERAYDFVAHAKRNNLSYVLQRGYNYDRLREAGEGDDWQ